MPPKKHAVNWRTVIENEPLNDAQWTGQVVFIDSSMNEIDRRYVGRLESFADNADKRNVVKVISNNETMFMINQIGRESKGRDDHTQIYNEAYTELKETKFVSPDILAVIVKHLILKSKEHYLLVNRQRLEVKEGIRVESNIMLGKEEVRKTYAVKLPDATTDKKNKNDTARSDVNASKKYSTRLRVRGEEWRDITYCDDYPLDGPNMFIAITEFLDPNLPVCLMKIGVPISAIIQIKSDKHAVQTSFLASRKKSQSNIILGKTIKYWEELQMSRTAKDTVDCYKDTAFLLFSPPYWSDEKLSHIPEKVYDEISYIMYDVHDLKKQHQAYIDNMDIYDIPDYEYDNDMFTRYSRGINNIPSECTTIYSVLDSIINTVSFNKISKEISDSTITSSPQVVPKTKSEIAEKIITEAFANLMETEQTKRYRLFYGERETYKDPILLYYGDEVKNKTYHVKHLNLDNIVHMTIFGMPVNKLWNSFEEPTAKKTKIDHHINLLLSCFDRPVSIEELHRMMFILTCRKLFNNRSSLHITPAIQCNTVTYKNTLLKRNAFIQNYDPTGHQSDHPPEPIPDFFHTAVESTPSMQSPNISNKDVKYFDFPDISELISGTELVMGKPIEHKIDEYRYFENYEGVRSLQVLLDAYNSYNCLDYYYSEVTDSIVLMFYNSHDTKGVSVNYWHYNLTTALCLQDFFDFVYEEQYDWIKERDQLIDSQSFKATASQLNDINTLHSENKCLNDLDFNEELFMPGSLKYKQFLDHIDSFSGSHITKMSFAMSTKSLSSGYIKAKSKKKFSASTPNAASIPLIDELSEETLIKKPFQGYNISDRRVECIGRDETYYSKDGTEIRSNFFMLFPEDIEYLTLTVIPGFSKNKFVFHKKTLRVSDGPVSSGSFMVTTRDNTIINVLQQNYVVDNYGNYYPRSSFSPGTSSASSTSMDEVGFHTLVITLPNGLIVETIHNDKSNFEVSSIKQSFFIPKEELNEYSRYVTNEGEVIVFKENGNIEVMRPGGVFINITKYEKNIKDTATNSSAGDFNKMSSKNKVTNKNDKKTSPKPNKQPSELNDISLAHDFTITHFVYTDGAGVRTEYEHDIVVREEHLFVNHETDYLFGIYSSKSLDGTETVINYDGTMTTIYPNNTQIISEIVIEDAEIYVNWTTEEVKYYEQLDANFRHDHVHSHSSTGSIRSQLFTDGFVSITLVLTIEHPYFATVSIDPTNQQSKIFTPTLNFVVDTLTLEYTLNLDKYTSTMFDNGYVTINHHTCTECDSLTTCNLFILNERGSIQNMLASNRNVWLKMMDTCNNEIQVTEDGTISIEDPSESEVTLENNINKCLAPTNMVPEECGTEKCQCNTKSEAQMFRFFNFKRDMSCTELIHCSLMDEYLQKWNRHRWTTIENFPIYPDQRELLLVFSPLYQNQTERWLMERRQAKPQNVEVKSKPIVKGYYPWMRPYKIFESGPKYLENVIPDRLPRAFILRTLERLCQGERNCEQVKEFLNAIYRYRKLVEMDSTIGESSISDLDVTEEPTKYDLLIKTLERRVYHNLSNRLTQEMSMKAPAVDIVTTDEPPEMYDYCQEEEYTYEDYQVPWENMDEVEKDNNDKLIRRQNYWKQRAIDLKLEEYNKLILREDHVPPYFETKLGGGSFIGNTNDKSREPNPCMDCCGIKY